MEMGVDMAMDDNRVMDTCIAFVAGQLYLTTQYFFFLLFWELALNSQHSATTGPQPPDPTTCTYICKSA